MGECEIGTWVLKLWGVTTSNQPPVLADINLFIANQTFKEGTEFTIQLQSSDPESSHELPDLVGSAIFSKFDSFDGKFACITSDTGTIHLSVSFNGRRRFRMMGDTPTQNINVLNHTPLTEISNPTNWLPLLQFRVDNL